MAKQLRYTNGNVNFGFSGGKWHFAFGASSFSAPFPKGVGREGAEKVANIINGSMKRSKAIDNLARANIRTIIGF